MNYDLKYLDLKKLFLVLVLFPSLFNINLEKISDELQIKLIDIQNSTDLRNKFQKWTSKSFYQNYMIFENFPRLVTHIMQIMIPFGSTYVYEQLFSAIKRTESGDWSRLNGVRLQICLRVAVSSISANMDQLVAKKQCQSSH